ncbi:sensor histidine kinase [Leucothrix sargassi]|nr:sensor histidine kinase [Leucothrix sargassi]
MAKQKHVRRFRTSMIMMLVFAIVSALVMWQTAYWTQQIAIADIRKTSQENLREVVFGISAELRRYEDQPQLISANEKLVPVILGTASPEQVQAVNTDLKRINDVLGSSDIYVMNAEGHTVAASNYRLEKTFIGKTFDFRPYFTRAMQGQRGNYFAYGITSKRRGYFFSYPVRLDGEVIGVVALKITVQAMEEKWRESEEEVLVVDDYGLVFLASDRSWHFHLINPLPDEDNAALASSLQYGNRALKQLPVVKQALDDNDAIRSLTLERGEIVSDARNYLVEQEYMAKEGWNVMLLKQDDEVWERVKLAMMIAGLILAIVLLVLINLIQRRRRLEERMALKDAHSLELEQKVKNRTKALTETNELLEAEVLERKQAEAALRETQAGLVQATKLAALGKMSAGVSHELNQPLAAIRSYSDNAKAFIQRGNIDTASDNLQLITELTDRMGRIIKNLRTYARDESISMRPVRVSEVINDSFALLDERIQAESIKVINEISEPSPVVLAGDVRLQQVFVNLFNNAMDSMRHSDLKQLQIRTHGQGDWVHIDILDTGTGVPEALREHVFDPFYSTKPVGEGMGLGLSITYGIIDQFGGKILIADNPDGGALFSVILKKAQQDKG